MIHTHRREPRYGFEESRRQDQRNCQCGVVGGPTRPLFPRALDDGSLRCNVTKLSNHSREDIVIHTRYGFEESGRQDQRICRCGVVGGPTRPLFPRALDDGSLRCNVTKLSNHSREDIVIHTRYGFEESGRQDQRICRCGVVGGPTRPLFPRALDDGSPRCNVTKLSNHSREDKVLHTHRQSPNGKWQIIAYL